MTAARSLPLPPQPPLPLLLAAPAARQHIQAQVHTPLAGLIKLRTADWDAVPATPCFTHLNAAPCTNALGGVYALTRIVKAGSADEPALMDAAQWELVVCRALVDFPLAASVPGSALGTMIGQPADLGALQALMLQRYRGLRPEWDVAPGGAVVLCSFERLKQ